MGLKKNQSVNQKEVSTPATEWLNLLIQIAGVERRNPQTPFHIRENTMEFLTVRLNGFKIIIKPKESKHHTPHFHIKSGSEEAAFSIDKCERLKNQNQLKRQDKAIKDIWGLTQYDILEAWNHYIGSHQSHLRMEIPPGWPKKLSNAEQVEKAKKISSDFINHWRGDIQ